MHDDQRDYYYRRRANGSDAFFAFMTGLVLGSVAAFMAHPDNRQKVKDTFNDAKKKGQKFVAETSKKAEDMSEKISDSARELADKAEKQVDKVQRDFARRQNR